MESDERGETRIAKREAVKEGREGRGGGWGGDYGVREITDVTGIRQKGHDARGYAPKYAASIAGSDLTVADSPSMMILPVSNTYVRCE